MRVISTMAALAALALGLPAQNQLNQYEKWDLTVEFTSRGALGGSPGHLSQGYAYGFAAGLETLTRSQYVMQDQNLATQGVWSAGTCPLNGAGQPDYARKRNYAPNLRLPMGQGIGAFTVTHNPLLQTPHKVQGNCEQWHHTWHLQNTVNWATDGLGVHMSQAGPWNMTLLCGRSANGATGHREIPRTDGTPSAQIVEGLAWSDQAQSRTPSIQNRSWRLKLWFDEISLNVASKNSRYNTTPCPDPNWGYASIDPDIADIGSGQPPRFDDLRWQVNAGSPFANGVAVLFWSFTSLPSGVPTPYGNLYVDITDPLMGIGPIPFPPLNGSGSGEFNLALGAGNSIFRNVLKDFASLATQAVVVSRSGSVKLSSLYSMRFQMTPPGWTAATAVSGTPASLTKSITQQALVVRNDGRGTLTVQGKRGSNNIGPATRVCEWTAVRIRLSAAANAVEISSNKTNATRFVYAWNK